MFNFSLDWTANPRERKWTWSFIKQSKNCRIVFVEMICGVRFVHRFIRKLTPVGVKSIQGVNGRQPDASTSRSMEKPQKQTWDMTSVTNTALDPCSSQDSALIFCSGIYSVKIYMLSYFRTIRCHNCVYKRCIVQEIQLISCQCETGDNTSYFCAF